MRAEEGRVVDIPIALCICCVYMLAAGTRSLFTRSEQLARLKYQRLFAHTHAGQGGREDEEKHHHFAPEKTPGIYNPFARGV